MDDSKASQNPFVTALTDSQARLYGYVLSLLGDCDRARDLLQQTNLILWQKSEEWTPGTSFMAWAMRVAYFEVANYRRSCVREKLVFGGDVVDLIDHRATRDASTAPERQAALRECLKKLGPADRELIRLRYVEDRAVTTLASMMGRKSNTVAQMLRRVRAGLLDCIRRRTEVTR